LLNNIKKLLLGNGLAQAIQFGSILILSRIYYPADFAILTQAQSIATLLAVVATLQMHLSIPMSQNRIEVLRIVRVVESLAIMLFILWMPIATVLGKVYVYALILTLAIAISNTCNSYLVFSGDFNRLSGFYVKRALLIVGVQFGCALFSINDGLLWGGVIGEVVTAIYLRYKNFGMVGICVRFSDISETIVKLRAFSLYGTLQELTSVGAFYAPLILFSYVYGADIGGQYAMVNRLVWAPTILLTSSVAQVLYHQFGKRPPSGGDSGSMKYLFIDKRLVIAGILTCAVAFQLKDLYLYVLGNQWAMASEMLPWGVVWGLIFLMSIPFRVAGRVLHLQRYQLLVDSVTFTLICFIFYFSGLEPISIMRALVAVALLQNASLAYSVWANINLKKVLL
jgi:O-antigen/teichoic acid export membrane protein